MQILHPIFYQEMLLSKWKYYKLCFTVTRTVMQMKQGNHCIESSVSKSSLTMPSTTPRSVSQSTLNIPTITPTSVSQSPLTKEKITGGICRHLPWSRNISRWTIQVQTKQKQCACKTCTKECSDTFTRWLPCQDTWSCQARCIRKCRTLYSMGQLIHHSWKGQQKFSYSESQVQEEVRNLSGSKRSQKSITMWALLFLISRWAHSKIP